MAATLPAYAGADFDSGGSCLHHPEVKLTQKTTSDSGRVVYKEVRRRCPKCAAPSSRGHRNKMGSPEMKRQTSMQSHGSGSAANHSHRRERQQQQQQQRSGKTPPSSPNPFPVRHTSSRSRPRGARSKSPSIPSRERQPRRRQSPGGGRGGNDVGPTSPGAHARAENGRGASSRRGARSKSPGGARSRSRLRSVSRGGDGAGRSRSRSRKKSSSSKQKKEEFATPFDGKGRCHHHSSVQLAKKKLTGGWKLLLPKCPKCIEDERDADNRSVSSRRSNRSSRSVKSSGGGNGGRKKLLSIGKKKSPRYECPFDNRGYCHRHSHVRLAKKKITGGWKILQNFCAECAQEDDRLEDDRSVSSRYSRKSAARSASSRKSAGGAKVKRTPSYLVEEDETDSQLSSSQSGQTHKKVVKKMIYTDDDGEEGVYTGNVNSQYKPHGSGKIQYNNGERFNGEWCEGTRVHGKTKTSMSNNRKSKKNKERRRNNESNRAQSSKVGGSKNGTINSGGNVSVSPGGGKPTAARNFGNGGNGSANAASPTIPKQDKAINESKQKSQQEKIKDYKALYNTALVVKNMMFVDFFGDRGRYTGEVNEQSEPHGIGEITYDHGLVQEGSWTNGVLDEDGSVTSAIRNNNLQRRTDETTQERPRRTSRSEDP